MDSVLKQLVQTIHDHPARIVLTTSGAGSSALHWLLSVAGASRTLIEARVPYDYKATDLFLGKSTGSYVSEETAGLLAGCAFSHANTLCQMNESVIGVACTAAIATDRPKKGDHRAFVTTWSETEIASYSLTLAKGARNREAEEATVSKLILHAIIVAMKIDALGELDLLPSGGKDEFLVESYVLAKSADLLLTKKIPFFTVEPHGTIRTKSTQPQQLLSGSFNPLHDGHLGMADAVERFTGNPVAFELTVANADKAGLEKSAVLSRIAQFAGRHTIYVSHASTFVEKSNTFNNTTFIVGYDTAERILQPRFYNDSDTELAVAMETIRANGCKFIVVGRMAKDGVYKTADSLIVPQQFSDLFTALPNFRMDISSTEIRGLRD